MRPTQDDPNPTSHLPGDSSGSITPKISHKLASPSLIPGILASITLLGQILWVLVEDPWRNRLTILTVTTFVIASATHAWLARGPRWASGYLLASLAIGLGVEILGTHTGLPFGPYAYTGTLGPQVQGVPLLIPLAWTMMSYPCLLMARRLTGSHPIGTPIVAAWTLAAWDLFLDPQMTSQGHWVFENPTPALPGSPGVPLTNYAGWLLTALVLFAALDRLPRDNDGHLPRDAAPSAMLAWTYLSNVMANALFWGRPAVAAWGAIGMGLTMLPWLAVVASEARGLRAARQATHQPARNQPPDPATHL